MLCHFFYVFILWELSVLCLQFIVCGHISLCVTLSRDVKCLCILCVLYVKVMWRNLSFLVSIFYIVWNNLSGVASSSLSYVCLTLSSFLFCILFVLILCLLLFMCLVLYRFMFLVFLKFCMFQFLASPENIYLCQCDFGVSNKKPSTTAKCSSRHCSITHVSRSKQNDGNEVSNFNRKVNKMTPKCTPNIQFSFILYNSYPNSVKSHW